MFKATFCVENMEDLGSAVDIMQETMAVRTATCYLVSLETPDRRDVTVLMRVMVQGVLAEVIHADADAIDTLRFTVIWSTVFSGF